MRRGLLCVLVLLFPSLAQAAVDWDDSFEYAGSTIADMNNAMDLVWQTSCAGNSVIIAPTTQALSSGGPAPHSGSKYLMLTYRGAEGVTPGFQSCIKDRNLTTATQSTLYSRFWIYVPASFQVYDPTTKITLHPMYSGDAYTTMWWTMFQGQSQLSVQVQKVWDPVGSVPITENITGTFIPRDRWACVETRITYATPGQRNGIVQAWIDGSVSIDRSNVWMDQTGQQSTMRGIRMYTQNGVGKLYYDDYAVSRDARIGCAAAPVQTDTTAPTVPTLSATGGNVVVQLSWTASTDASGILRYEIRRSTTASTGPFTALATVSGTTLSYQDTGLTNGTTYYYQVSATDQAVPSNTSAFSSTATATPAAPGGASATVLSITATGRFAINGVTTLIKCASYYDIMNYHTSDIDALAADGFNCIDGHVDDVLRNNVNSAYNADGTLKAAKQTAIEAAIDYADTKGMVVLLNCTYADVDGTNTAAWLTSPSVTTAIGNGITNCINAFKANGNLMFSIVNEHIYGAYADTHAEMQTWMTTARSACATCLIGFSSTDHFGTYPAGGHLFTTQDGSTVNTTNVEAELATGVNFLLWHDERNSGFNTRAQARAAAMRAYLDNNGHQNIPFFGDEPAREPVGATGGLGSASAWIAYYQALQTGGIQGVTLHSDDNFDMDPATKLSQSDAVEQAVMDGLSAALTTGTGQVRAAATITDTFDRANNTDLGVTWAPETLGNHTNLQIVGNRVRPTSTTLESRETRTDVMPDNQWACIDIPTFTSAGTYPWVMVKLRYTAPGTVSGYDFRAYKVAYLGATTAIVKKTANIPATLVSNSTTWAAGDQLCAEAVGSTLTLYKNNVAVATATDTAFPSGRVGLYAWSDNAVANIELDNFTAGGFTAPPVIVTPQILTLSTTTAGATFTFSGSLAAIDACTHTGCIKYNVGDAALSISGSAGTLTYAWKPTDVDVCIYAYDPNGARNNVQYVCYPAPSATDVTAPIISNAAPSGVLIAGTTSTTLSWNTNEPSYCKLNTTNVAYASMSLSPTTPTTGVLGTAFTYTATGLANSTTYTFYVACADEVVVGQTGNISTTTTITFSVETPASVDTTVPSTVTNLGATVLSTSQITFSWSAATDNVALHTLNPYRVYFCDDAVCTTKSIQVTTTNTSVTVSGLSPSQTVYTTVRAVDSSNNESAANSNIVTTTTQPLVLIDTVLPSDPVGLTVTGVYANSVSLTWTPGVDNQGAVTTAIELCSGSAACTAFELKKVEQGSTTLVLGLTASTVYRARILHIDRAGNPSLNYSERVSFTTTASSGGLLTSPRLAVPFGTPRLDGSSRLSSGTRLAR